jgi:hypothetical protein
MQIRLLSKLFTRSFSAITMSSHPYHRLFQDLQIKKSVNKSRSELLDKNTFIKEDMIISHMKKIKPLNKYSLNNFYILEADTNIIDKIKLLTKNKPFEMNSSMFVQLYLQLETNPMTNKFVYEFRDMSPQIYSINNHNIDNDTRRLWTIYPSTYQMTKGLYDNFCSTYYADIIQIEPNKFIGLTIDGFKIATLLEWIDYIYYETIKFVNNKIVSLQIETNNTEEKMKTLEKVDKKELLRFIRTPEFNYYINQLIKLDNVKEIQQYIELGFLDLLTVREKYEYCMNICYNNSSKVSIYRFDK